MVIFPLVFFVEQVIFQDNPVRHNSFYYGLFWCNDSLEMRLTVFFFQGKRCINIIGWSSHLGSRLWRLPSKSWHSRDRERSPCGGKRVPNQSYEYILINEPILPALKGISLVKQLIFPHIFVVFLLGQEGFCRYHSNCTTYLFVMATSLHSYDILQTYRWKILLFI